MEVYFDQNGDNILEEVVNRGPNNVRTFKFSENFKNHLDNVIDKAVKSQSERKIELITFMKRMAKMKEQAVLSTKETVANILLGYHHLTSEENDKNTGMY